LPERGAWRLGFGKVWARLGCLTRLGRGTLGHWPICGSLAAAKLAHVSRVGPYGRRLARIRAYGTPKFGGSWHFELTRTQVDVRELAAHCSSDRGNYLFPSYGTILFSQLGRTRCRSLAPYAFCGFPPARPFFGMWFLWEEASPNSCIWHSEVWRFLALRIDKNASRCP